MTRQHQRGSAIVLVVVGMLSLIAIVGLAVDTAHVLLNKSRLQSALDSAALAAAKALDQSASTAQATTAAGSVFTLNVAQYPELQSAVSAGLAMTTQYSSTLSPFTPGSATGPFVRTSITGFRTSMSLITVLGIASISVTGTAVAGPSAPLQTACNIVPVFMCGTPSAPPYYGYSANQVVGLNQVTGGSSPIGPGNYGLLSLGGNGAAIVRSNLAGDYAACATIGTTVPTEPGVAAGPVSQGINTRFNDYKAGLSAAQYPPDVINSAAHQTNLSTDKNGNITQGGTTVTTGSQLTFNYANYAALLPSGPYDTQPLPNGTAAFNRRIMAAPVGDCTGAANGKNTVSVSGFLCVLLLQDLGNGSNDVIYAQVLNSKTPGCISSGTVGGGAVTGPHKIELYKSAGSPDS